MVSVTSPIAQQTAFLRAVFEVYDQTNPHVHIIGHPTTRLIGSREPVEFDFNQVVQAAAKAQVALEINGSPLRLDLNDTMARAAQEAGVLLAINSDAHSVSQLEYVRYGVYVARRAWVQPQSVVNTWPWAKLQRWLRSAHAPTFKASAGYRLSEARACWRRSIRPLEVPFSNRLPR